MNENFPEKKNLLLSIEKWYQLVQDSFQIELNDEENLIPRKITFTR